MGMFLNSCTKSKNVSDSTMDTERYFIVTFRRKSAASMLSPTRALSLLVYRYPNGLFRACSSSSGDDGVVFSDGTSHFSAI